MMKLFTLLVAAAAIASPVSANDTLAEVKTGGLIFAQSDDVSMAEDDEGVGVDEGFARGDRGCGMGIACERRGLLGAGGEEEEWDEEERGEAFHHGSIVPSNSKSREKVTENAICFRPSGSIRSAFSHPTAAPAGRLAVG